MIISMNETFTEKTLIENITILFYMLQPNIYYSLYHYVIIFLLSKVIKM